MVELLQSWLTIQAERRPEDTALVLNRERVRYGQLEQLSNQLARILKKYGCAKNDRVCVLAAKSPVAIMGILGVLKADCIYVPLDPAGPAARLARIMDSCENRWILAAGAVTGLLGGLLAAH